MSIILDPFPFLQTGKIFPLQGPPIADPDWQLAEVKFVQPAWDNAFGEVDFVEFVWETSEILGSGSLISKIVNETVIYISQNGGQALAYRLYHRPIFDISVPDQVCLPDDWFFVGGCHDIPIVGGTTIISAHQWYLQLVYHNAAVAIGIWGFLSLLLIIGAIGALVLAATNGRVDLGDAVTQPVKELIEASAAGATRVGTSLALLFFAGAAVIVALATGVPQLGTQTSVRAGPVTTTLRGREPPSTRRSS